MRKLPGAVEQNGLGHMTKMVATPKIGKNLYIFSYLSLKAPRPIVTKFHVGPPAREGTKMMNGSIYMTNMAAMSIYGKNLEIFSSWEPLR